MQLFPLDSLDEVNGIAVRGWSMEQVAPLLQDTRVGPNLNLVVTRVGLDEPVSVQLERDAARRSSPRHQDPAPAPELIGAGETWGRAPPDGSTPPPSAPPASPSVPQRASPSTPPPLQDSMPPRPPPPHISLQNHTPQAEQDAAERAGALLPPGFPPRLPQPPAWCAALSAPAPGAVRRFAR